VSTKKLQIIGSLVQGVSGQIETHNTSETAHSDIRAAINNVSALVGDESVATQIDKALDNSSVYVTPQMYGAVGDGVTDDTLAFQNALAENDNVFVPQGNYLITGTLDISYKKSLVSDDGQRATLLYSGTDSMINVGRMSIFRNINITVKNDFNGKIFDTNNYNKNTGETALSSRVEHVNVDFDVACPNVTLIGITVDSGTDANNVPRLLGVCFQTYHDIQVDNFSQPYGYGIKMELIQGRAFAEDTEVGFPWITHIDYDDIFLGHPKTAIKSTVTNTSGAEQFSKIGAGHILLNNVYSQHLDNESTQIFFDLDNFTGCFTKVKSWDYYPLIWEGKKINIIGENVSIYISDSRLNDGDDEFLHTCDFTVETDYNVNENPSYFISKYFSGSVFATGYDSIDAKIEAKLTGEFVANVAEEKINDILYHGYSNVLADPLTQILVGRRWSTSGQAWEETDKVTTVVFPLVAGGNIIRWTPTTYLLSDFYKTLYFFNDDALTSGIKIASWENLGVTWDSGYIEIENPNGYKYLAFPFCYYEDISAETMTITINREITSDMGLSYTDHLKENVVIPEVERQNLLLEYKLKSGAETWTFTLEDGSTVTKKVVLA